MGKAMAEPKPAKVRSLDDIIAELEQVQTREKELKEELTGYQTRISALLGTPAPIARPKAPVATKPKAAPGPSANFVDGKHCEICNGLVGHDGRAHRSQSPKVKFTDAELTERGLQSPA